MKKWVKNNFKRWNDTEKRKPLTRAKQQTNRKVLATLGAQPQQLFFYL